MIRRAIIVWLACLVWADAVVAADEGPAPTGQPVQPATLTIAPSDEAPAGREER